jgi:plastocyanin
MLVRRKQQVAAAALAAAVLTAPVASPVAADMANARRHVVEIHQFKFVPAEVKVAPGDTIVWVNRDFVPHTATAADKSWDSGTIKPDGRWQITVRGKMGDAYYCHFHPAMTARLRADK